MSLNSGYCDQLELLAPSILTEDLSASECLSVRRCIQVTVPQFDALSLLTLTQFEALSPNEYFHIWGTASHNNHKTLQSINRTIPAVHAVHIEWSLLPSLFPYLHIYLSLEAISWLMMHCGRRILPSGMRLLCGRQQRLQSASSHIVKSSLPDVEIPSTAVPDYVWQRVDQWADKVAIVSMQRAYKHLHVTFGSRRLTTWNSAGSHKSTDSLWYKDVSCEHKNPCCGSTEHLWEGHVTVLWWTLFKGGKRNCILWFDVVMALFLMIGTSGLWRLDAR